MEKIVKEYSLVSRKWSKKSSPNLQSTVPELYSRGYLDRLLIRSTQ